MTTENSKPVNKKSRFVFLYLGLALVVVLLLSQALQEYAYKIKYFKLIEHLEAGHVTSIEIGSTSNVATGKIIIPASWNDPDSDGDPEEFSSNDRRPATKEIPRDTQVPFSALLVREDKGNLAQLILTLNRDRASNGLPRIDAAGKPESDFTLYLLIFLPILIIVGFWLLVLRQSQAGRAALTFGRSKARLYAEKFKTVTFKDVAGCDEAKVELLEIVDFLRNPKKYQTLGGRMPKGVLLVGPPGTGKTLIARAVAGEAKRPFFSLSGSEFVEMFVGVGASRVRDLFQQAKDSAPCIIFIDELDAVGRQRGAGLGGGHDEREQTLNQLLVEMDGFDMNSGIIILAATNRPDVLDPALLRPGRFDRQVVIDAPDLKGREAILHVHSEEKPLGEDVELGLVAAATPGFTGADLANVLNEAALLAARRDLTAIGRAEVEEATERIIAGPERKSRRLGEGERRRVAYHEAGHALVAALSEHADPVRKISIIPRGHAALGYTMQFPEDDRYLITKEALEDRLKSLLAGRSAERLIFNEISTGAQDDLNKASDIARGMVCRFGMSEKIGPIALGKEQRQVFLGRDIGQEDRNYSENTAMEIDGEIRHIIEKADAACLKILETYRSSLENVAETLLEKEVLQGEDLDEILEKELGPLGVDLPHIRKRKEREERERLEQAKKAPDEPPQEADSKKDESDEPEADPGSLKKGWAPS